MAFLPRFCYAQPEPAMMYVHKDGKVLERVIDHFDVRSQVNVPRLFEGEIIERTMGGEVHIIQTKEAT